MKLHIDGFGPCAASLQEYADLDGFIPTPGSQWQDFRWPHSLHQQFAQPLTGAANWQSFCRQAEIAVNRQNQALLDLEDPHLQKTFFAKHR